MSRLLDNDSCIQNTAWGTYRAQTTWEAWGGWGMAQLPVVGQGLLIIDALRAHSDTTLGRTPLEEFSVRRRYVYKALRSTPRVR